MTTSCALANDAANNDAAIETRNFMDGVLFLNADRRGARREDDAVFFPLWERHIEQPHMRSIIELRTEPLPVDEFMELLFRCVAPCLFITGIV